MLTLGCGGNKGYCKYRAEHTATGDEQREEARGGGEMSMA